MSTNGKSSLVLEFTIPTAIVHTTCSVVLSALFYPYPPNTILVSEGCEVRGVLSVEVWNCRVIISWHASKFWTVFCCDSHHCAGASLRALSRTSNLCSFRTSSSKAFRNYLIGRSPWNWGRVLTSADTFWRFFVRPQIRGAFCECGDWDPLFESPFYHIIPSIAGFVWSPFFAFGW